MNLVFCVMVIRKMFIGMVFSFLLKRFVSLCFIRM